MSQFINYPNVVSVVFDLFRYFQIKTDRALIAEEFELHPDSPSLLSLSDVLTSLGLPNDAAKINFDDLIHLEFPVIAHTNYPREEFVLVTAADHSFVTISNGKKTNYKQPISQFKQHYLGTVLFVEKPEQLKYNQRKKVREFLLSQSMAIILLFIATFIGWIWFSPYFSMLTWQITLLTFIKGAGLITSILLLTQSLNSNNPLIQKVCKSGEKMDCNAILSSKAANVTGGLTWSEVGFFYYAITLLLLLFGGASELIRTLLVALNIMSLPYTFYSVYYQSTVAKKWCLLCCTVQTLLWIELLPGLSSLSGRSLFEFESNDIVLIVICTILPVAIWGIMKPLLIKGEQAASYKKQLRDFKFNNETFKSVLRESPKYTLPEKEWSLVLGNSDAQNTITMITNPYCPPCSATHKLLHELLEQRNDLQARIVFVTAPDSRDKKIPVSRHLMALSNLRDKGIVKRALNDWYELSQKDYDKWAMAYPVKFDEGELDKIEKQRDWCDKANVTFTPTVLLNGSILPEQYKVSDLKYMLEAI